MSNEQKRFEIGPADIHSYETSKAIIAKKPLIYSNSEGSVVWCTHFDADSKSNIIPINSGTQPCQYEKGANVKSIITCLLFSATVFLITSGHTAHAQSGEDFYKNRHVDLIVATTPGGGYDVMARIFARHMPRFLPGTPNVVVKNMPGAGGIAAANNLFSVAAKDGSVFAAELQGVAFQPLFGDKAARYDAAKFTWIGNANSEIGTFFCLAYVSGKNCR